MIPRSLATAIVVLVSVIWAANFVLQFVIPSWHPDVTINGIFMGVVGTALALSRKDGGGGGGSSGGGAHAKKDDDA